MTVIIIHKALVAEASVVHIWLVKYIVFTASRAMYYQLFV